jgi:hypothetical protein
MRFLGVTACAVAVFASVLTSPASAILEQDGLTALVRPNGVPGDSHFRPPYFVWVTVYEKSGPAWGQVATDATLHVLVPRAEVTVTNESDPAGPAETVTVEAHIDDWVETAAIPFTSTAVGNVIVNIPASAIVKPAGLPYTLVRVVVQVDDGRASHNSLATNEAILTGNYDLADALDTIYQPGLAT